MICTVGEGSEAGVAAGSPAGTKRRILSTGCAKVVAGRAKPGHDIKAKVRFIIPFTVASFWTGPVTTN